MALRAVEHRITRCLLEHQPFMVLIHSKYIWHYYNPDTRGSAFLVSALTQPQWPAVSLTTLGLNTQLQTSLTSARGSSSWKKMIKLMIKYRGYLPLSRRTLTLTRVSLEVQDECFLGFVKTGLGLGCGQFITDFVRLGLCSSKGGLRLTMEPHCGNLSDCK